MKVSELIGKLCDLDLNKEIRFQELHQGHELPIDDITEGEQGDWYVIG